MQKKEIEEIFYIKKNYSKIKELLKNSNESWSFNMLGKIAIEENNFQNAYKYFDKANNLQACAYCKFITGEIIEAKILLSLVKNSSPFVNWLLFLIDLNNKERNIEPTYFQIRNFYEQDLENLFVAKQYERIEEIINQNSYLERFNREIYKYSARVLFNNDYTNDAQLLLKKSIDICYNDPETHFMMGEIHIKNNNKLLAIESFKKSTEVNNGYLPAISRLKDLCN